MKKVFSFFIALLIVLTGAFSAYGIEDNNSNSEVAIRGSQGDFYYQYYQDYLLTQQMQDIRVIDDVYEDNSSYSKSSYESIDVTVDKTIINVGEDTEVTITVTENGQPLVGEQVILHGYTSGYTDENGQLTVVLHPEYSENFFIEVKGEEFFGVLFAIQEDEGVVEVTGKDINGNDFEYFYISVRQDYIRGTGTRGTVARNIARQGTNLLTLVANQNEAGAYYIVKEIEVIPGQINTVFVNSSDYVETTLQFKYNDQIIKNGQVRLGISNIGYDFMEDYDYIGETDESGYKKIYVTPGVYYNISISGKIGLNETVFLTEQGLDITNTSNEVYALNWTQENTARFILNTNFDNDYDLYKFITLNNIFVHLEDTNELIMNAGSYTIDELVLMTSDSHVWYSYRKPWQERDQVLINAGETYYYNVDLSLESINLDINNEFIDFGDTIYFDIKPILTKSGYLLENLDDLYSYMNVAIQKPNGEIEDLGSQWFRDGMYYLDYDEPEGTYTINATMDLGPLYDSYIVSNSFEVSSNTSNDGALVSGTIYIDGYTTEDIVGKGYAIRDEWYFDADLTQNAAAGLENINELPHDFSWKIYIEGDLYLLVYLDKDGDLRLDEDEPRSVLPITLDYNNPIYGLNITLKLQKPEAPFIVSVSIDNHPSARPQAGLNDADIIYESAVAPGITRFLAVYDLSKLNEDVKIGPVRSAREYFVKLVNAHGGGFAHAGGSFEALNLLQEVSIIDLDEIYGSGAYFYRTTDRAMPHNLYTSSELLKQAMNDKTDKLIQSQDIFNRGVMSGGEAADIISVRYIGKSSDVYFEWNESRQCYERYEDEQLAVLENGEAISANNIVVVYTLHKNVYVEYLDEWKVVPEVIGKGKAQFYRNGKTWTGEWQKTDIDSNMQFIVNGEPMYFDEGNVWILIVDTEKEIDPQYDLDNDGNISLLDLAILASYYGARTGDERYVEEYDFNNDNIIDIYDFVKLAKRI